LQPPRQICGPKRAGADIFNESLYTRSAAAARGQPGQRLIQTVQIVQVQGALAKRSERLGIATQINRFVENIERRIIAGLGQKAPGPGKIMGNLPALIMPRGHGARPARRGFRIRATTA
jgi:hypothetical protein